MFKFTRVLFVLIVALSNATNAQVTTYTFESAPYVSVNPPYTTSMRVTGSFTTSSPLPPNLALTAIGDFGGSGLVTSYSFDDGVNTYTPANSSYRYLLPINFRVGTDASGEINEYDIFLVTPQYPYTPPEVFTELHFLSSTGGYAGADQSLCQNVTSLPDSYCSVTSGALSDPFANTGSSAPGNWTRSVASSPPAVTTPPTPVPALPVWGAIMLCVGLLLMARRRFPKI